MKKTTSQVIKNIKCNFPILFIAGQPLNEMGAVHALVVQILDKSKSKSKYRYVGKIVWDITPTLR